MNDELDLILDKVFGLWKANIEPKYIVSRRDFFDKLEGTTKAIRKIDEMPYLFGLKVIVSDELTDDFVIGV